MLNLGILALSFFLSLLLTRFIRELALKKQLIDIPNERSSHLIPTPRGGGLSFVIVFLSLSIVLFYLEMMPLFLLLGLGLSGSIIAIIGFIDDRGHVSASIRLFLHFLAAMIGVYFIGGLPILDVIGVSLKLGFFANVLAVLYVVWLLNLFNFMDGIDGIASLEACTVLLGGICLFVLRGSVEEIPAIILLAGSVLGFLVWNFPPAKIFMGDAGSGFLGIVLGLLSLYAAQVDSDLFWGWLILLAVFVVDATFTLFRRALNGEAVYEAHRSHAYQYASRVYNSHKKVSVAVAAINLFYLLPLSILVALNILDGFVACIIAYLPLLALAIFFKAGNAVAQNDLVKANI